ncbi:MAG: Transcriptional regulator, GntR family [uncultured Nocardioidaceae bacterium]|uniref:Transcriptional regulator, GntR family n=1 Tax=uncultured Nocardioidaceae bacterium TaxID=253824 RepID=A0A6J4M7Q4_9ACTN|nr:MAG: Transcriptional regulator, GntR family [uncultured Nocardioidaceae bacterium]
MQSVVEVVVDTTSPVAPYEQVRAQLAASIAAGTLPAGSRLATVRQLAADLGIAANTVARAYRELEADGVIVTQGRRGSFVPSTVPAESPVGDLARAFVLEARTRGLTCPEALRLVEDAWGQ